MAKAKCLGLAWREKDGYNSPTFEYEYRGYKYYATDYRNGCSETLATQHFFEQCGIDKMIEMKEAEARRPFKYENTAEYGLNKLFEYWETGVWEDD